MKLSKPLLFVAGLSVGLLAIGGIASATNDNEHEHDKPKHHKVLLCHVTKSEKYPFLVLNVDWHAKKAHLEHGDFLYLGEVGDYGKPKDHKWCEDHQPGDVCLNLPGKQESAPEGMVLDDEGNCVEKPPVVEEPPVVTDTPKPDPQAKQQADALCEKGNC